MRKPKPHWILASVKPRREDYAAINVTRQGYECYNPRFFCERMRVRRSLFPGYLFVNSPHGHFRFLENTFGCFGAVMFGETVATVPLAFVKMLKKSENKNGLVTLPNGNFRKGQGVKVVDGPFKGQPAIFAHYSDQRRVCILLSILGKEVRAVVPDVFVEAA